MARHSATDDKTTVSRTVSRINEAWSTGHPENLSTLLHDAVVMVLPGFAGRVEGKGAVLAGFEDFCRNCRITRFDESDRQVDVAGPAAVASFAFDMTYERDGSTYRGTGRDVWIFAKEGGAWRAVWRTMLDVIDEPAPGD